MKQLIYTTATIAVWAALVAAYLVTWPLRWRAR